MQPQVIYTAHALKRMKARSVSFGEVREVLESHTILEQYEDDQPFPSVLGMGQTSTGRVLHVVYALSPDQSELILITVYSPDEDQWQADLATRR